LISDQKGIKIDIYLVVCSRQDIETFDLEDFKYNSVNITAFRLVDVESPKVADIINQMKKFQHSGQDILNGSSVIMVRKKITSGYSFSF
jgi:ionotropic glutamate receptor